MQSATNMLFKPSFYMTCCLGGSNMDFWKEKKKKNPLLGKESEGSRNKNHKKLALFSVIFNGRLVHDFDCERYYILNLLVIKAIFKKSYKFHASNF
jgi:hypothetical protein